jgi:hypothetical protein
MGEQAQMSPQHFNKGTVAVCREPDMRRKRPTVLFGKLLGDRNPPPNGALEPLLRNVGKQFRASSSCIFQTRISVCYEPRLRWKGATVFLGKFFRKRNPMLR